METQFLNYNLDKLPPDSLILTKKGTTLPEVVGFATMQEALSGANSKILMSSYLLKYGLKRELLTDGVFIPLPYDKKDSKQVVLVHCQYELALEQFFHNIVSPLGLTADSLKLFFERYDTYIGERQEREETEKLNATLTQLSLQTGTPIETLRKRVLGGK